MKTWFLALLAGLPASVAFGQQTVVLPLIPDGAGGYRWDSASAGGLSGSDRVFVGGLTADAKSIQLDLERFSIAAPGGRFVMGTDKGDVSLEWPRVQLWRGRVVGQDGSYAYLAVGSRAVNGYFRMDKDVWIISSDREGVVHVTDGRNPAIVLNGDVCGGMVGVPGAMPTRPQLPTDGPGPWPCRAFALAVDADFEFTNDLFGGDATAAAEYIVALLGGVSEIYQRDTNVSILLTYARVWTTAADPYAATNTSNELPEFQAYWNSNMGGVPRDLAHLLSGRSLGGGIAYGNVACHPTYGYAVSSHLNGFFPYPLQDHNSQNWDVTVVSHEMGHNLGSRHTHDPAQYVPPIDGCGNAYLNPPQTQDCSQAWNGTIMSYCHLCPGGEANLNLTFGPRVATAIRTYLDNSAAGCGTYPALSISQQPSSQLAQLGAATSFSVVASGPSPFTYQWKRNDLMLSDGGHFAGTTTSTLNVSPVAAADAGSYTVDVGDSCGLLTSNAAVLTVQNSCYPNCDNSTTLPVLTANDFQCFLNRFATANAYANCDGSSTLPILTANDFQCFLNAFAVGCT